MSSNSAGAVGAGNEGQTDKGRGSGVAFSFSKSGRKTGKVGGGMAKMANDSSADANKRTASHSRLAK